MVTFLGFDAATGLGVSGALEGVSEVGLKADMTCCPSVRLPAARGGMQRLLRSLGEPNLIGELGKEAEREQYRHYRKSNDFVADGR